MRVFLLILPLILLLAHSTSTLDPALAPRSMAFNILVMVLVGFTCFSKGRFLRYHGRLAVLTLLSAGWLLVSSLWAPNPSEAAFVAGRIWAWALSALLLAHLFGEEGNLRAFSRGVLISILVLHGAAIYQVYLVWSQPEVPGHWLMYITSQMANKNLYAQFSLLAIPFVIHAAGKVKAWRIPVFLALALSGIAIVVLQSRAVWMAAGFATLGCLMVYGLKKQRLDALRSLTPLFGVLILGVVVGVALTGLHPDVRSYSEAKVDFEKAEYGTAMAEFSSKHKRLKMWDQSVKLWMDAPIAGNGLSSWKFLSPKYGYAGPEGAQGRRFSQRPHNEYLGVLSEQGLIGLLLVLLMFGQAIALIWKQRKDAARLPGLLPAWWVLISFGILAGLSFPAERPMLLLLLAAAIAVIHTKVSKPFKTEQMGHFGKMALGLGLMVVSCFFALVAFQHVRGERYTRTILNTSDPDEIIDLVRKSASAFFSVDPNSTPIAWYSGVARFQNGNYDRALDDFHKALGKHPNHLHVWNNLGASHEIMGNSQEAISSYEEALALSPKFSEALCNLAATYYNIGDYDKAYEVIDRCELDEYLPEAHEAYLTAILQKIFTVNLRGAGYNQDALHHYLGDKDALVRDYVSHRKAGKQFMDLVREE